MYYYRHSIYTYIHNSVTCRQEKPKVIEILPIVLGREQDKGTSSCMTPGTAVRTMIVLM